MNSLIAFLTVLLALAFLGPPLSAWLAGAVQLVHDRHQPLVSAFNEAEKLEKLEADNSNAEAGKIYETDPKRNPTLFSDNGVDPVLSNRLVANSLQGRREASARADNSDSYRAGFVDVRLSDYGAGDGGSRATLPQMEALLERLVGRPVSTGNSIYFSYQQTETGDDVKGGSEAERPFKGRFAMLDHERSGTTVNARIANRGYTCCIDLDELEGNNPSRQRLQEATDSIKRRLLVTKIAKTLDVLKSAVTIGAELDLTNAELDLVACLQKCASDIQNDGSLELVGVSNPTLEQQFQGQEARHLEAKEMSYQRGDLLARADYERLLGLASWVTSAARCRSDKDKTSKPLFAANELFLYARQATPGKDDPSLIKHFVRNIPVTTREKSVGQTVRREGPYRVFVSTDLKLCYVTVEEYSDIVATGTGLGKFVRFVLPEESAKPGYRDLVRNPDTGNWNVAS